MAEHDQVVQIEDDSSRRTTLASSISLPEYLKIIKVLCFLFDLKKHTSYLLCSSFILCFWFMLIKPYMNNLGVRVITTTLATFVIYTLVSMLRILIFKGLDCYFHNKDLFLNVQDHISNEYFLQTLLGFSRESNDSNRTKMIVQLKWIKKTFANLSCTICDQAESSISLVFKNITNNEPRDIQETDLFLVMDKESVAKFLQFFNATTETKSITQESLRDWVTMVCNERKRVIQLLHNTSQDIERSIYVRMTQLYLIALLWCHWMRIVTTISSMHLSPVLFICSKLLLDGILLARVMHSFDIGDHCIIENEQFVVTAIGFNSTVFRKDNNETVTFTNLSLYNKSISNLNRSSKLTETFEILVSRTTSSNNNAALKLEIDKFIHSKPENWHADDHCFISKGVDDGKDMYNLEITNVRKFQNFKMKKQQRSEFILHLKVLLEDLGIVNFTIK